MGGVEELTPWTGRVCYALFYVCIALNNLWFPSKWSIWNYMDKQQKKCFHAQGIFFARMEVLSLCFVLSMVLRLDAEHIENTPNVGRRRVYLKEKKRRHISATEDDLEPFYLKKKNSNNDIIYKVHIHIIVCSTFRNLRSFDWFNVQWRCSPNVHCGNYRRIPMSRLIKGIVLYRLSAFISFCLHIAFQRKGIYLCIQTVGKIHVCKWSSKASRGSRGWTVSSSLWSLSEVLNLWAFFKKKGKKVRQQLLKSNTSVKTLVVAGWKLRFNNWEIRNIWNAHLWMHCWGEPGQLLSVKFQHSTTAHRGNVLLCGRAEAHVK